MVIPGVTENGNLMTQDMYIESLLHPGTSKFLRVDIFEHSEQQIHLLSN